MKINKKILVSVVFGSLFIVGLTGCSEQTKEVEKEETEKIEVTTETNTSANDKEVQEEVQNNEKENLDFQSEVQENIEEDELVMFVAGEGRHIKGTFKGIEYTNEQKNQVKVYIDDTEEILFVNGEEVFERIREISSGTKVDLTISLSTENKEYISGYQAITW